MIVTITGVNIFVHKFTVWPSYTGRDNVICLSADLSTTWVGFQQSCIYMRTTVDNFPIVIIDLVDKIILVLSILGIQVGKNE